MIQKIIMIQKFRLFIFSILVFMSQSFLYGQIDTIAVAPFQVIGQFKNQEMYSHGIPEAIANDLSQIGGLKIIERLKLSEVLQELKLVQTGLIDEKEVSKFGNLVHAEKVVLGTIQKMGNNVHVNARIIAVKSGEVILSVEAERQIETFTDIFRLQDMIAKRIILKLKLNVTKKVFTEIETDATNSEEAFQLYSKGIWLYDTGYYKSGLNYFQQASVIDPDFEWVKKVRMRAEAAFEELEKETKNKE